MSLNYTVPFYSNTPDDTHCFQAGLRMILKYFWPEKDFSWKELEKMTAKVEGLWTWPMAGLIWMKDHGFEVVDVETFDYNAFIKKGSGYLYETFGEEVAETQVKNSKIPQEIEFAKKFIKIKIFKKAVPTLEMIKKYLKEKYLVGCTINMQTLNNENGYVGHFVVIKGYDNKGFVIHDPGLPPVENRSVSFKDFERCWADPNEKAKNIMAFKLKNTV